MQCTCVRQTDLPNTTPLFADLIYRYDRVSDLYPWAPNSLDAVVEASKFAFPDDRRAAVVEAIAPLNEGNAALRILAEAGTVAVITGQQVGLFSGPAYTVYKALTAIRIAEELNGRGVRAVPLFWLATEDHDFAEVDHAWVFGPDYRASKLRTGGHGEDGARPVGGIEPADFPLADLKAALEGLPFADDAMSLVEGSYRAGQTMGAAFAGLIRELFAPYGLLLIDPMTPALRRIAAPLMQAAVERMPELCDALIARGRELVDRGYHAQVLVDAKTSLAFLLEDGRRTALRRSDSGFTAGKRTWTTGEMAARAAELSPNALLRPVVQDYLFPTAAYVGGAAELAYFAQSQVLYKALLVRQPVGFPRAGFTLLDERAGKRMAKYRLNPTDLFVNEQSLRETISRELVAPELKRRLEDTKASVAVSLDGLAGDLRRFDVTLASALDTSRRKIEFQVAKIARKSALQILAKDEQAGRDAASLHGLAFPEDHLQERLYSIVPFIAKFGPGLIGEIYEQVRVECPDHQFVVV